MGKLIECIPNFSEGRSREIIDGLVAEATSYGSDLLDYSSDPDHNRTVITFAGDIESVIETAFRLAARAVRDIDMRRHDGVHPRIGALDVLPLVPLRNTGLEECTDAARRLGRRIAAELELPVYYYGAAAVSPDRVRLSEIRRGGFEGLEERMCRPQHRPDQGPCRPHPTAGALALGVREALIAYNVNLQSQDLQAARRIASRIRERDGGLPGVDALGVRLDRAGLVQVTVNLRNRSLTSLDLIYRTVCRLAAEEGIAVAGGEIIGLVPLDEVLQVFAGAVGLDAFPAGRVLECGLDGAVDRGF